MPEPRDPSKEFTIDETIIAQMYEHEALLKLLIEKGMFTKEGIRISRDGFISTSLHRRREYE